ncbi:hypothetical protein FDP41_007417 [Naegleria fowleri]|uniref:Methionine synthase reductase n=1 Tax=Naegleria fowleri TaxID=5763 RepID=A0A6A5CF90_NAEFO|nr:uncharacterized protein FDP41_007417 [Naegleria fowleri]KAF0984240.1 hypothetical protein FDP41_007417 [Naegleria fowleri]CAG4709219.1 unnamed protein product [Naegleria fowleri]
MSSTPLFICYGSETGNAKAIATRIYKACSELQLSKDTQLQTLNDFATNYKLRDRAKTMKQPTTTDNVSPHILDNKVNMIIICSTTGNGDVPQNADNFYRFIKLKSTPAQFFANLSYSLLGLGDSNYDSFCNAARNIDKRLLELGAERIGARAEADEVVGLEVSVEPYIAQVLQTLRKIYTESVESSSIAESVDTARSPRGAATDNASLIQPPNTPPRNVTSSSTSNVSPSSLTGQSSITSSSFSGNTEPTDSFPIPRKLSSGGKDQLEALSTLIAASHSSATEYLTIVRAEKLEEKAQVDDLAYYNLRLEELFGSHCDSSEDNLIFESDEHVPASNVAKTPNIFYSSIRGARYLTTTESSKQVLHLELDMTKAPMSQEASFKYEPGDALGIFCENDHEHVDSLIEKLKERGSLKLTPNDAPLSDTDPICIKCTDNSKLCIFPKHISSGENEIVNIRTILTKRVDIMAPVTVPMLQVLAKYCSNFNEKNAILKLTFDTALYNSQIVKQRANLFDILSWYPSCKPRLSHLLQELPPLLPRYYSISSSPIKHPDEAHIAFSIIKFETPPPYHTIRYGSCTSWLQNKAKKFWSSEEQVNIPVFVKPSPNFRLPENLNTPIIMIGPGTGVAPFRGFLQHRECMLDKKQSDGVNWLFFGCRSMKADFLYRDDLRDFETNSFVNLNLLVASSREADSGGGIWYGGSYVQDYLREYSANIVEMMMMKKGVLYVCGDAQSMATQVNRVLHQIIEEECNYSPEQAKQVVSEWQATGRYLKEVWS